MALLIERIAVERIDPAPYNPRLDLQPTDPEYEKLKRSLETFGCVESLVWNRRTGHLVGGHQRLKVLRSQGCTEVSVSVVDLSIEQEKALNVALNRIQGGWDEPKLADLLQGLAQVPDFDVSLTGFDRVEMRQLLDRMGPRDGEDNFDVADALDQFKDRPAITQAGELIELGSHRLLCCDSANSEDVARLLDGAKADLVWAASRRYSRRFAPGTCSSRGGIPRCWSSYVSFRRPSTTTAPTPWRWPSRPVALPTEHGIRKTSCAPAPSPCSMSSARIGRIGSEGILVSFEVMPNRWS